MPAPEEIAFGALSHERECPICGCPDHRLRCLQEISEGVMCPCGGGPAPGIYPN